MPARDIQPVDMPEKRYPDISTLLVYIQSLSTDINEALTVIQQRLAAGGL
jgi:hypothetical protein